MTNLTTAPYGEWISPINASDLATSGHPVHGGIFVGDQIWWAELRSSEGGRIAIRRAGDDGEPVDVLPAPWNARTRVHEYGGGAWSATPAGSGRPALVFTEFTDQRLYRLDAGSENPVPLTPAGLGFRFADISVQGNLIWAVRETHVEGPDAATGTSDGTVGDIVSGMEATAANVTRDICTIPLDGAAADDASQILSIVSGSHFLAYPRISPDGGKLAWIAWEHPLMPWDGTELRVGDIGPDGTVAEWRTIIGSETESVLQPEWRDDSSLVVISDREGWWNLYGVDLAAGAEAAVTPIYRVDAEVGGPMWQLGMGWYDLLDDGTILAVKNLGTSTLVIVDPATGDVREVETPLSSHSLSGASGGKVLLTGASAQLPSGLRLLDLATGEMSDVRLSVDDLPEAGFLPEAEERTFVGDSGRDVHAIVYPPRNPGFAAPEGELPPYVAFVHGGPTSQVAPSVSTTFAYFTSRGIGVVDVNYGGSTGYGREYRERLRGQWGIVDVEDVVAAVTGLADAGMADGKRLAIEGGSAGGWTVLAALTSSTAFACGASYFGVAELKEFVKTTHDFESRYVDGLIGALPEAEELYDTRAPLNNVDNLNCPVLLLQGLDDPIVPPAQAELFRDALVRKGIAHAYRPYEGESHGFRRAETIIDSREAELSFYGQVMGFTPPGIPVLELSE